MYTDSQLFALTVMLVSAFVLFWLTGRTVRQAIEQRSLALISIAVVLAFLACWLMLIPI
jgi:hypothetical protein